MVHNIWEWTSSQLSVIQHLLLQTIVTLITIFGFLKPFQDNGYDSPIPDVKILGYTKDEWYKQMENWGPDGRQAYIELAIADILVLIPIYIILIGGMLYKALEAVSKTSPLVFDKNVIVAQWTTEQRTKLVPHLVFGIAISDIFETTCQIYSCTMFPNINSNIVFIGQIGNHMKFTLLAIQSCIVSMVIVTLAILNKKKSS